MDFCFIKFQDLQKESDALHRIPRLDEILKHFCDGFPSELLDGLPPKRNIDHHIDIVPSVAPISIPPYRVSRSEEDEVSKQLKDYL